MNITISVSKLRSPSHLNNILYWYSRNVMKWEEQSHSVASERWDKCRIFQVSLGLVTKPGLVYNLRNCICNREQ